MLFSRILQVTKHKLTKVIIPVQQFSNLHIQKTSSSLSLLANVSSVYNPWIYQQNNNLNLPQNINSNVELPNCIKAILPKIEPIKRDIIEAPALDDTVKKEAVKMIVIRRKKMKKHKLRKLRKRMKFEWAKKRQRRELKKEKLFQAELIQQYKTAEKFSAEEYVTTKLKEFDQASELLAKNESSEIEARSSRKT
ncbi:uncharacterized protein LOC130891521 [Diorhabda carinulata]|uniref:uncharacterized protein LOC130891521 n=1 Tax=Diorhabda carinulata TaxID=1163345 RepID=UPI0025A15858|nr:uncharacterized protein LOC130891521 [Diorhabda carinulata]